MRSVITAPSPAVTVAPVPVTSSDAKLSFTSTDVLAFPIVRFVAEPPATTVASASSSTTLPA